MPTSPFGVEVKITGRITDKRLGVEVVAATGKGLLELATIEGQGAVQKQLYPGHGFITGHLFKHIGASLVGPLTAQFDAGANRYGKNLVYAGSVEARYSMFGNAYNALKGSPDLWKRYIGPYVMKVFSK